MAQRTGPSGEIIEEEIPTPEEEAMLVSAGGYGPAPIPPPAPAAAPPADTSMYAAPVEAPYQPGGERYVAPSGFAYDPSGGTMGDTTNTIAPPPAAATDPYNSAPAGAYAAPVPEPALNYDAAEPYGTSAYGINAGGDSTTLRSQAAYAPPPLATMPPPRQPYNFNAAEPYTSATNPYAAFLGERLREPQFYDPDPLPQYNFNAAEPSLADRRLPMRDTEPVVAPSLPSVGDRVRQAQESPGALVRDAVTLTVPPPPPPSITNAGQRFAPERNPLQIPPPPRQPYNYAAAEPSLMDRTVPMIDAAPVDPLGNAVAGAGDAFGRFDDWSQEFFRTPQGRVVEDAVLGAAGPGGMSFGRVASGPVAGMADDALRAIRATGQRTAPRGSVQRPSSGMPAAPESLPIPEPPGAVSAAAQLAADESAARRAMTEAARQRLRTASADQAAQEAAAASLRARRGTGADAGYTSPNATTPPAAPAAGAPAGRPRVPSPSKRGLALAAGGLVGGGILANNLLQPGAAPADATIPDPPGSAPRPLEPGIYSPSTNPQTPDDWVGATTRSLELMKGYSPQDWAAGTKRSPVEIGGIPQKLIESATTPGLYVGYVDVAGNVVPVGSDVSPEDFVTMVVANAAEAEPGWGDIASPSAATPTVAADAGTDVAAIPPPVESLVWNGGDTGSSGSSGGGGSRSGGGGWIDYGDGGSSRSSGGGWIDYGDSSRSSGGRSSSWVDDDDDGGGDFDAGRDFTADDFMDTAKGDRRKAEFMARAANRRRKSKRGSSGATESGGMWPGFPMNRPPSPIRANILTSLDEAFAQAFPNRRG